MPSALESKIPTPAIPTNLEQLYEQADSLSLAAGWMPRQTPIMGSNERSRFLPQHWRYDQARSTLDAAGRLVDVALAERRNLILRNSMPDNEWATSRTLVCAYQMILPREVAPSHRHTSNALRVIIDAVGAFSVVDGAKMPMESGDVVLTPSGHWHGHGHEGVQPAYWLDCLDVPLTYLLEPMYFMPHPQKYESIERQVSDSPYRFSRAMIATQLDKAAEDPELLAGQQVSLPTPSMPAMGLRAERLLAGTKYREHRKGANRIYSVMQGSGTTQIGCQYFHWERGDTFLAPSSYWTQHRAAVDALLLEMSDEPLMRFTNSFTLEVR